MEEYDSDLNMNNSNENALNQKILKLKETIINLTEKKNYYKSKVNLIIFLTLILVQNSK